VDGLEDPNIGLFDCKRVGIVAFSLFIFTIVLSILSIIALEYPLGTFKLSLVPYREKKHSNSGRFRQAVITLCESKNMKATKYSGWVRGSKYRPL
jgi:hypothetical protein